jgi:hypothetical protein
VKGIFLPVLTVLRRPIHDLREPKKNVVKILYLPSLKFKPFLFEQFDFSLDRPSRCFSLKSPNPTGCGNNPVSGDFGRIGVVAHGLTDPAIGFAIQGMGDFLIGGNAPFGHLSQ